MPMRDQVVQILIKIMQDPALSIIMTRLLKNLAPVSQSQPLEDLT